MYTKAQKKKKELLKKKILLIVKLISAIVLILSGVIYWYNNSRSAMPEGEGEKYETFRNETVREVEISSSPKSLNEEKTERKDTKPEAEPETTQEPAEDTVPETKEKLMYDSLGRLNINTAGKEELCKLNGIGEKRANDIIEYRNENGDFNTIEDIMKVKGIKQGIFSKIKDYIFCG